MTSVNQTEDYDDRYGVCGGAQSESGKLDFDTIGRNKQEEKPPGATTTEVKRYRVSVVSLGLLCVLLLVVMIWMVTKHTVERDQQQRNMGLLQLTNNNLTQERDHLQARNTDLTKKRDDVQARNTDLTKERDHLQARNTELTKERDHLQARNTDLTKRRDHLQARNTDLTKERDHLQARNTDLTKERDHLQARNGNLTKDRDQLQISKNQEAQENDQLTTEMNDLRAEMKKLQRAFLAQNWKGFGSSFYRISTSEKNWTDSRQDCMDLGAYLVIIDSGEEQNFISGFTTTVWIGLNDIETEGSWKWENGKVLDKAGYWVSGEPNNAHGNEHCVHVLASLPPLNSWNDYDCSKEQKFICEMKVTISG